MSGNSHFTDSRDNGLPPVLVFLVYSVSGGAVLTAIALAKYLIIGAQVAAGLGRPTSVLPGLICTGIAFASPVFAASVISIFRLRVLERNIVGIAWMAAVLFAFIVGSYAHAHQDTPVIFSRELIFALPAFSFGWCIPLLMFHYFRGWRIELAPSSSLRKPPKLTVSSLLAITMIVGLCFYSLQYAGRFQFPALFGMAVTSCLAFLLIFAIWLVFRLRCLYVVLGYVAFGFLAYAIAFWSLFAAGAPGRYAMMNASMLTAFAMTILGGYVLTRLLGGRLITGHAITA